MSCANVLLELLQRCDRSCAHCYNVWRHCRGYPRGELQGAALRAWAERCLAVFHPRSVTVIGGEPLLHNGLFELLEYLGAQGVETSISTHGGLVDLTTARRLSHARVRAVEVSLCGSPGERERAARALRYLEEAGLHCTASVVLSRPTLPELRDLVHRAVAFGATSVAVHPLLEPWPGALEKELVADDAEIRAALELLAALALRYQLPVLLSYPAGACRLPESAAPLARAVCDCRVLRPVVDPLGNVRRCEVSPAIMGNVFRDAPPGIVPVVNEPAACAGCSDGRCQRPCQYLALR
jgi:MoaA/NifB/PqqE/SkfB family radical SAM enzyme